MKAIWRAWLIGGLVVVLGCKSPPPGGQEGAAESDQGAPTDEPGAAAIARGASSTLRFTLSRSGLPEAGNWKCDPVLADVNGDGFMDLAAHVRLDKGPQVWLGDGQGNWHTSSNGLDYDGSCCGGGLGFADINNDGNLDLALADHCHGVFVYLGDGQGGWELVARDVYPVDSVPAEADAGEYTGAEDIAVGDVNGDGFLDLVAGSSDKMGGISVYLGDGSGHNWSQHLCSLPTSGWATRVVLTDLNGDDFLDLIASHNSGPRAWYGDGQGGWELRSEGLPSPTIKGIYNGLAAGDVNEDGLADIAVSNWVDGPEVYLQQSDGSWQKTPDVFPQMLGGAYGMALGDVDQDGHLDMVVSGRLSHNEVGYVYGVFVLLGDGQAHWAPLVGGSGLPETGLPFTWGVALADVNVDGVLDVVAGSGGIVATSRDRNEPTIPAGMLVWATQLLTASGR